MGDFLEGKVVAVTGGGGGIGRAVALAAATRAPKSWSPTSASRWPARTPRARWPRRWSTRSPVPVARRSPWRRVSRRSTAARRSSGAGVERWGRIDGVVCVAGILRERMLFNMSEEEWDAVVETHLKGHFTLFRAASAIMRKQEGGGSLVAFTSGAFAGSVAQANYAAAKGGVVSSGALCSGRAQPLRHHRERDRPGRSHPHVGERPDGARRERRSRRRRTAGRVPPVGPGQARDRSGLHGGRTRRSRCGTSLARSERSTRTGDGRPRRSPTASTRRSARNACRCSTSSRRTGRRQRRRPPPRRASTRAGAERPAPVLTRGRVRRGASSAATVRYASSQSISTSSQSTPPSRRTPSQPRPPT